MGPNGDTRLHLLLTRPAPASARFLAELEASLGRAIPAVISPLLRIAPHGVLPDLGDVAGVIFTSEAGVAAWAALGGQARGRAWCVGARTAAAAQGMGFEIAGVAETADDLVQAVTEAGPLVHLHGRFTRGDVVERLRARGLQVAGHCLYDQVAQPLSDEAQTLLGQENAICVPLFSPRTAELLAEALPTSLSATLFVCVMSDAVAQAARGIPAKTLHIAASPTGDAMRKEVAKCLTTPHVT